MLSSEITKVKDRSEGKTEKQDYKCVNRTIMKKLGDCEETQSEGGRFSVLIVGIHSILELRGRQPRFSCAVNGY